MCNGIALRSVLCLILAFAFGQVPAAALAADVDGNGFEDAYEQQLINKFCPSFVLHSGDHGVSPEPVSIMTDHGGLWVDLRGSATGEYNGYAYEGNWLSGNYSWIQFPEWTWPTPSTNCGNPAGASWGRYHFDYGGPGPNCDNGESNQYPDQPEGWYENYALGSTWNAPARTYPHTVYAHPFKSGSEFVIQYFFFYPFNDWIDNHEGDWEHINVMVSSDDPSVAHITHIAYYFHKLYKLAETMQTENPSGPFDCYVTDDSHPVVFVGGHGTKTFADATGAGEGSHGSYPVYGHWNDVQKITVTLNSIEITLDGLDEYVDGQGVWIPWYSIVDADDNDLNGVVLTKNPGYYDYVSNPQMSWLKADVLWGHPFVRTFGSDWELRSFLTLFAENPLSNLAPRGPAHQDVWNSPYTTGSVNGYGYPSASEFPHASDANWSPPPVLTITTPPEGSTTSSETVYISGVVYFDGGIDMEWGEGTAPTEWHTSGFVVPYTPYPLPYVNPPFPGFASWDTRVVPSGTYTLRATATAGNGYQEQKTVTIHVNHPTLYASISGPDEVQPQSPQVFLADASGGVSPYTYNWYKADNCSGYPIWMPVGTGVSVTVGSRATFCLKVVVHDQWGETTAWHRVKIQKDEPTPTTSSTGQRGVVRGLQGNHPNPFNGPTTVEYGVDQAATRVVLSVYDLEGRLVTTLEDAVKGPGQYHVDWSGKDASGQRVVSGVYFIHLQLNGERFIKEALLLK